jgi:hypothetical protein
MFEAPVDAWYVWLGLAVASTATLGVATSLPAAAPPDATGVARTIDSTAASQYPAVGRHPAPNAAAVRVGGGRVSLRGPGGTARAALGYGPVTPVGDDDRLQAVLRGEPPARAFGSPEAFERALHRQRAADPRWIETDSVVVRRLSWEGIDAVLVG